MNTPISSLFLKCEAVYEELEKQSEDSVFTGAKSHVLTTCGISLGNYTPIYYYLSEMGCILEEKRGSRMTPSVVRLIKPPKLDDYDAAYKRRCNLTRRRRDATLQEQIDNINGRLPNVDLTNYLMSLDAKLTALEAAVKRLENKGG